MLYYSFKTDADPKVIGVKDGMNQVRICPERFTDKESFSELESFLDFRTYWQRTDRNPSRSFVIEYAKLRRKAKLTDFLVSSHYFIGCPFMLSAAAKEVFSRFHTQPSFLFDAFIYDESRLVDSDYSLFYFPLLGPEVIDFAKSRFRVNRATPYAPQWEYYSFPDLESHTAFCDNKRRIPDIESLVMSKEFDANLDFFQCKIGPMFMSEQLKKAVEEAGLSNILFPFKTGSFAFSV